MTASMGRQHITMSAKNILLLFVIGIILTSCNNFPDLGGSSGFSNNLFGGKGDDAGLQFQEVDIRGNNPKKGLVIGFQEGNPGGKNNEIFGEFNVGLDIANYMPAPIGAELDLWDSVSYPGFEDKENVGIQVDIAQYDVDGKLYPGVGQYPLGFFSYDFGEKGPYLGATTQFFASVKYNVQSDVGINFCVTNPKGEFDPTCKNNQALTTSGKNAEIDSKSQQYPVYIKNVMKSYFGTSEDLTELTLEISIANEGGGNVVGVSDTSIESNIVNFDMISTGVNNLRCRSDNSLNKMDYNDPEYSGLPMKLTLNNGKSAKVTCNAKVSISEPIKSLSMNLKLDYTYLFETKTNEITVKG